MEEGLAERGRELDVVACVGQQTIRLEGRCVPRVEEAVNGGGRRGRTGGSGGGACCQDDALGCRWEAVQPLCLLFHLALGGDDGTESFGCMQPGRHIGKDVRETQVVLWGRRGRLQEIHVCPSLEPDAPILVRAKGEWHRKNLRGFDGNGLEEGQDVVAIVYDGGQRLGGGRLGGGLLRLTWLFRLGGGRLRLAWLLCLSGFDRHDDIVVADLVGLA